MSWAKKHDEDGDFYTADVGTSDETFMSIMVSREKGEKKYGYDIVNASGRCILQREGFDSFALAMVDAAEQAAVLCCHAATSARELGQKVPRAVL
jgi:hypothetical protein